MNRELVSTLSSFSQSNGLRRDAGRLDSSKEIASYFRREVRTVQLWEKREGLPVHRHFHQQLGSVFAFRSELDAWNEQVSLKGGQGNQAAKPYQTPSSTEGSAERSSQGRITIRVEPLRNETIGEQTLCDTIAAKTIAALGQLNPERLSIEVAQSAGQQGHKSSSDEIAQGPVAGYILKWAFRITAMALAYKRSLFQWRAALSFGRKSIDVVGAILMRCLAIWWIRSCCASG